MGRVAYYLLFATAAIFVGGIYSQTTIEPTGPTPEEFCNARGNTCGECINSTASLKDSFNCYFCNSPRNESIPKCRHIDFDIFRNINDCPGFKYNYGTCSLSVLIILILMCIAIFLFVVVCCCCCCLCCCLCAKRSKRLKAMEEERYLDEKDQIRQRSADRHAERKSKHDEIRRKYVLVDRKAL